ncbi:zinc ribbon domain-containing protein [Variovorax sp. KBS0712]|uniref:zinc ribbon domain-containing protein n=1 Tax=Variovorax sp. KBS0712 TaxID=2578111 RepID=UPI00111934F0|nr:zinc ribbon domain-containing protein [Variovorax sp. KBS0712]TSD53871.1 zinc ribbon domain-containing protein [Variovorax sp. KBS0712]
MALICPVCDADNREGANFCRNCGGRLSAADRVPPPAPSPSDREWATTAPAQLRAPTIPAPLFDPAESKHASSQASSGWRPEPPPPPPPADEKTVIVAPGRGGAASSLPPSPRADRPKTRIKVKRIKPPEPVLRPRGIGLWLGLLAVALLLVVAGWLGYGTGSKAPEPAVAPPPVAVPAPAATPPVVEAPPVATEPAPPVAEAPPAEAITEPAEAAPKPTPVAKPRKPVTPPPPTPQAPAAAAPVAAAPAPAPASPAPPADPQAQCGDRNFIAKAQCMAAQCVKPEYRSHAQCEAVRRQQRIEEEKRNPSLLN